MKESELRIGNLLETYLEPQISEWIEIYVAIETLNNIQENPDTHGYRPIQLTEEWLLKLGFEEDLSQLDPPDTPNGNFWAEYEKNGVRVDMPFFEYNHDEINIEIKHVHQLQNLYFALTGEELTLKN
jgi:hypothetical protein